jgi:Ni2+-binding GTPase involved in maturation of urease and hydrogenase
MTVVEALQSVQYLTIDGQPMAVVHADLWEKIVQQLQNEIPPEILTEDEMRQEDEQRIQRYRETGYAISHDRVAEWLTSIGTENELPCPQ